MALIKADRVKESSTSAGASTFLLNGAFTGFRSFSSVCSVGDTFYYVIDSDLGSEWETGLGTYSAANTLTRTTVYSSSNGGSIVTFSAGTKNVYISLTGQQLGTLATLTGSEVLTNKTINASNNTVTNVSLTTGVTGTLPLANGGTGTTTAQLAINALAGAVTSGSYLRGNGTNVVMATIAAGDVPTLNQNTTGTASGSVSGTASYVPKFTSTNVVGNSQIFDNGTNVGIGTTSPAERLHLYKSGDAIARIEGTTASVATFHKNSVYCGYVGAGSAGNNDLFIYNLASAAVRINNKAVYVTSSDTVGINETSPGAQLQVTTGAAATKGLIVKGASAQSANLQEWQNNAGTALAVVDASGDIGIGTSAPTHSIVIAKNGPLPVINIYKSPDGVLRSAQQVVSLGTGASAANSGTTGGNEYGLLQLFMSGVARCQLYAYAGGGVNSYVLDGMSFGQTSAAEGQVVVAPVSAATKGLIVKGFTSQSANLQEWQNTSGTALAYVNSAGDIWGAGGGIFTGTGNGTDGYGESGPCVGVNKWLSYTNTSIYYNIRKLYGSRVFPATNANGDYVEIAKISRQHLQPITLTIHASHGAIYGAAGKVYVIAPDYNIGNWTAAPLSGGKVGDFDFDVELVAPDPYWLAVRVRRHSSSTLTSAALMFTIESHNYNRGGMVELSGTGNSASALPYNSNYMRIGPTVSAPPPAGGSGAGTNLAIYGGSAIGTGAGGNILLQAGAYATSGSNGKVIVRGLASNTANLQEWQNNAGTVLSAVNSAGSFTNTGGYSLSEEFGAGATVTDAYATAIGNSATASQLSLAIGSLSSATGTTSTAVGAQASADGGSTAVGRGATASGGSATAVGVNANATGNNSIAIGRLASSNGGIAIGYNFTGAGLGYTSFCASVNGIATTGAIAVYAGDGVNNGQFSRQHSILGTWATATYASRLGRVQLRVNDYTTDREAIRYESDGANALTSIGGAAVIASTTLAVQPAVSGNKGIVVKGASGQSANLQEWQNNAGSVLSAVKSDGSIQPASMADSAATNNSIYYSTTASKLVYKDAAGTVNNLY